jgi:hypothetical protein
MGLEDSSLSLNHLLLIKVIDSLIISPRNSFFEGSMGAIGIDDLILIKNSSRYLISLWKDLPQNCKETPKVEFLLSSMFLIRVRM